MASQNKKRTFLNGFLLVTMACSIFIIPVGAISLSDDFQVGDSRLPIDEEGFIQYAEEWEEGIAFQPNDTEVTIESIYQNQTLV
ncbi:MAG: hypothetical protein ACFFCS_14845, partial [Candidatus Hodarchaeota archaeon]